jgi:hypothetical protein
VLLALGACTPATAPGEASPPGSGGASGTGGSGGSSGSGGAPAAGSGGAAGSPGTGGSAGSGGGSGGTTAAGGSGGSGTGGATSQPGDPDASAPVDAASPAADEPPACKQQIDVSGPAALAPALAAAKPGDCLRVADGNYGALTISTKGTADAPIQIKAANLLKASASDLKLETAEHTIVSGFAMSTVLFVNTKYARVTRCQVKGPGTYWVRIEEQKGCSSGCNNDPPGTSDHARLDHCDIGGGSSGKDIFNPTALATNTRIDHNYIHDASGDHLMTLGCCGPKYDYFESGTIVEQNLFVNANGTSAEMISIKGAGVHFRYNTIRKHNGDIDIRAGRKNLIYGNYILGPGPGIRMYEDDHKIYNNYVVGGLSGNQSGPIHAPVKNALVVHNTFTGGVALAGGAGNVSANNILLGGGGGGMGNLGGPAAAVGLSQMGDILVIGAGSKAIGAAVGSYPFVMDDISGHPRGAKPDVGAQQFSTDPPLRKVLTTADVGPMAP